jgi:hypothetical protein
MSPTVLRDLHRAKPFQPFVIHTVDGEALPVPSPEFLSMNPSGRIIIVWKGDEGLNYLDSILISRVEMFAPLQSPGSNGATSG